MQRFDPRFWTVDFPRPMMASARLIAPDALRVDCEFQRTGDLAGLIWESEDRWSHPLIGYATNRDYSHTVMRFHWRSQGLIPLDQPDGPTLTIEGRDAAGRQRAWYVRLWNYAEGSPEDAQVTLPFSELQAGWALPGEAVHVAGIDRMFISLVPPGYRAGGDALLPERANAWAELTGIDCYGDHAMVELGAAMLPPHGERLATGYDDAYNQTPQRLVRTAHMLGYRDALLHYVGMSHFFRLVPKGGDLSADRSGALCEPARAWHAAYFSEAAAAGFEVIASLSYELFAQHCPADWQQRAHDGAPGRTGWEPPSALLSPANEAAMGWLQAVAARFVALQEAAGLPVRFQIGEPWWWVQPETGAPCLYDDAARAAFGGDPPVIEDARRPMSADQTALLDEAGALLAASTAALAQAVRDAAAGEAELLLLAFTPTILDPASPEMARANLPVGLAFPAFDRLQLEDYDWLTDGRDADRRLAYAAIDDRLGYPLERQDYLSGFVLRAEDAEPYWRRIDAGLDEAAERGIARRYVWAEPQVARDGYTRLPPFEETAMRAFDDVPYPLAPGRDISVAPEFSTSVAVTASGHERRRSLWADARMRYDVGPGIRSEAELEVLLGFFRARRGAARGFRLTDPFDHSSSGMTGTPTALDQRIGTGDGHASDFALAKIYGDDEPQHRRITRPRPGTVRVAVDALETTGWTLLPHGVVRFTDAPPEGAAITAGFLFDVPVRFAEDRLDVSGVTFAAGEAPSVPLIELREAA